MVVTRLAFGELARDDWGDGFLLALAPSSRSTGGFQEVGADQVAEFRAREVTDLMWSLSRLLAFDQKRHGRDFASHRFQIDRLLVEGVEG